MDNNRKQFIEKNGDQNKDVLNIKSPEGGYKEEDSLKSISDALKNEPNLFNTSDTKQGDLTVSQTMMEVLLGAMSTDPFILKDLYLKTEFFEHPTKTLNMAMEELAGLMLAISKNIRENGDYDNTCEEVAGVTLAIGIIIYKLGLDKKDIQRYLCDKITRTNIKLEDGTIK